jgi:hypothetical protein
MIPVPSGQGQGQVQAGAGRCRQVQVHEGHCRVISSLVLVTRQRGPAWGCCRLVDLLVVDHFAHVRARHRDEGTTVVLTKKVPRRKVFEGWAEQPERGRERERERGLEDTLLPFQYLSTVPRNNGLSSVSLVCHRDIDMDARTLIWG